MKLVQGWKYSWKWFSVQAMTISVALGSTWAVLPDDLKLSIPSELVTWVAVAISFLGLIGRLVEQK